MLNILIFYTPVPQTIEQLFQIQPRLFILLFLFSDNCPYTYQVKWETWYVPETAGNVTCGLESITLSCPFFFGVKYKIHSNDSKICKKCVELRVQEVAIFIHKVIVGLYPGGVVNLPLSRHMVS